MTDAPLGLMMKRFLAAAGLATAVTLAATNLFPPSGGPPVPQNGTPTAAFLGNDLLHPKESGAEAAAPPFPEVQAEEALESEAPDARPTSSAGIDATRFTNPRCPYDDLSVVCLYECSDRITQEDYCFIGQIDEAKRRVLMDFAASGTVPAFGLVRGPANQCDQEVCVANEREFGKAVAAKLHDINPAVSAAFLPEGKLCVTGTCPYYTCSRERGDDACILPGPRDECVTISSFVGAVPYHSPPQRICMAE